MQSHVGPVVVFKIFFLILTNLLFILVPVVSPQHVRAQLAADTLHDGAEPHHDLIDHRSRSGQCRDSPGVCNELFHRHQSPFILHSANRTLDVHLHQAAVPASCPSSRNLHIQAHQVSRSKKWDSKPAVDENGNLLLSKNGKPILIPSYSILQDQFFNAMRNAGYDDIERGRRGSTEEHLTVTQFKVQAEQGRLSQLEAEIADISSQVKLLEEQKKEAQEGVKQAKNRLEELAPAVDKMENLARQFSDDPEQILPQAGTIESAKNYREKKAKPLLARIVKVLRAVYSAYLDLYHRYENLQQSYSRECAASSRISERIDELAAENKKLRSIAADFNHAKKALGKDMVENSVDSVKQEESKSQTERKKKQQYSR